MKLRTFLVIVALLSITACAGQQKFCANFSASNFGTDWIVVQYAMDGTPFHCWKLRGAAVDSGTGGNVDWQDTANGHLVHLTGWENRVQVMRGDFAGAGRLLGVEASSCDNGLYPAPLVRDGDFRLPDAVDPIGRRRD